MLIAGLATVLVIAAAVSVVAFSGIADRFADASAREGSWGRQAAFEIAPDLATGRSVSITQPQRR